MEHYSSLYICTIITAINTAINTDINTAINTAIITDINTAIITAINTAINTDFNALCPNENLILRELENWNFKLLIQIPTHVQGGAIDHCYI